MDKVDRVLKFRSKTSAILKNPCLKSMSDKLYEQRHETGDIKFIIEGEEIPAHRCVLAALSPKYKAQFYGPMSQKDVVNVNGASAAAFKEFLQFFYLDEVKLSIKNIEDVLNLAKQSLVDELITECTKFLFKVIGMDRLIWFYRLAIYNEIVQLEEFCLEQISAKIKSVFKTSDFLSCEQEMLCHIMDFDSLNCDEMDVFNACILWAWTKCQNDGVDAANTANLRVALGDAIFQIRFCSMAAKQFAIIEKRYSGLLSEPELNEVYRTIALKTNGETSNTFGVNNTRPREFKPIENDWMNFCCDKTIHLNGFVICDRIDGDIDVQVEISGVPQRFNFIKLLLDNETKIIFDNPIYVKANEHCRIEIESDSSIVGYHGFSIVNSAEQCAVSFQLEELLCGFINSITRLLYNKYISIESSMNADL